MNWIAVQEEWNTIRKETVQDKRAQNNVDVQFKLEEIHKGLSQCYVN